MRIRAAATVLILTLNAPAAWAQATQQVRDASSVVTAGTAVLTGVVVVDEPTKTPLRRAIVIIAGTSIKGTWQVITNDRGQFAFTGLSAGRFTVTAEKLPFVKTYYGSRRPGRGPATPIALVDRQERSITIALQRGVVLSGTVTDEGGTPIGSSQVHALQPVTVNGERKLVEAPFPYEYGITDERGQYRIYGLPAGQYTVVASGGLGGADVRQITQAELDAAQREIRSPPGSSSLGQPIAERLPPIDAPSINRVSAYWPGVTDPDAAQVVALRSGEEREGLDVVIPIVRAARIDGISLGPDGQPIEGAMIGVANVSTNSVFFSPGGVRPGPDGRFSLASLAPATYLFYARGSSTPGPATMGVLPLWAEVEVPLNGQDVSGVLLQFAPGRTVTGRLDFGGRPMPDLSGRMVGLRPFPAIPGTNMPVPAGKLAADGTFSFTGVAPGKYRVLVQGITGWSLRSAMLDGRDTLDAPLEVPKANDVAGLTLILTDRPTEISGTIFDQLGRPTPEYAVFVFAADRSFWTTAPRRLSGAVKPDSAGKFTVTGLPPGEYYIAALIDADPRELSDPSFLEQLIPSSIRITLGEGEKKTQDLRLGGG